MALVVLQTLKVWQVNFFMRHYGSASVKPTMIITNNKAFWALDAGKLSRSRRKGATPTTKRYRDGKGRARFSGTPRLKESQNLVFEAVLCFTHFGLFFWVGFRDPQTSYKVWLSWKPHSLVFGFASGFLCYGPYQHLRVYPVKLAAKIVNLIPAMRKNKPSIDVPVTWWQLFFHPWFNMFSLYVGFM